jgi:hypothetical protein
MITITYTAILLTVLFILEVNLAIIVYYKFFGSKTNIYNGNSTSSTGFNDVEKHIVDIISRLEDIEHSIEKYEENDAKIMHSLEEKISHIHTLLDNQKNAVNATDKMNSTAFENIFEQITSINFTLSRLK